MPENGWVLVDADYVNARVFWRNVQDIVNGGWTGTGTVPTTIGFFDVNFTLNYTDVWIIDNNNNGYPYISDISTIDWHGFEKGTNGYPLNVGVWKLDNQNNGYPWIVGYLELTLKSTLPSLPYILSNGTLSYMSGNIINYDTLQSIFIYKKGENI